MNIIRSKFSLLLVFTVTSIVMAFYESIKEFFFEGTLLPWESHTITIFVTAFLATLSAYVMRSYVFSLMLRERDIQIKEQSLISFELVLSAVNHIVNNVLNYLQIVKLEIETNGRVSTETMNLLDESIKEADMQMKILNKIHNPSDKESYKEIYPT